ncbi:hypothetical protein WA026_016365 [Henosepilachna vigintioctopunctata]|uniref:Uncharacterized protein n=1 Tax=Henosepilachna vigintioctopunctata TaxID=420089 RepID=A0AAW1UL13_9CUCU
MITVNGATQLPRPVVESSLRSDDKCMKHLECTENALAQYENNNFKGINRIDIHRKKCKNSSKKKIVKSKNNEVETYNFIPQASVFVHILSAFISQTFDYGIKNLNSIKITSHIPTKSELKQANNFARSAFTLLLKSLNSSSSSRTPLKSKALDYHHTKGPSQTSNYSVRTGREKKKPKKSLTKNNSKEPPKVCKKSLKTNIENDTIVRSFPDTFNEPIRFPKESDIIFEKRDTKQCNNELLLILENRNFNKDILLMYKGKDPPTNKIIEETYEITTFKNSLEEKNHEQSWTEKIQEIITETHITKDHDEPKNTSHALKSSHSSKNSSAEEITKKCEIFATIPKDVYSSISAREEFNRSLNSKQDLNLANINQNEQNYENVRPNILSSQLSNHEIFKNVEAEEMTRWIKNIPAYNIDNSIKTLYVRKRPVRCRNRKNATKHHIEMGNFKKEVISFLIQNTFNEREKCYTTYYEEKKILLDSVDEEPMSLELPSIKLRMPKFSQFMPEIELAIKDQMNKFLTNNRYKYHDMSLGDHNFKRDLEFSYQKKFSELVKMCR